MGSGSSQPEVVLAPVEQETISFYGHELVAVRLEDGRIAAVLRWLCEGMGLDVQAQMRRIQRKTVLREDLVQVRVSTPGGLQAMPALVLHGLPGWLYGVDETRMSSDEARAGVVLFQREATDVLYRHFSQAPAQLAAPSSLVPAEQIEKPTRPPEGSDPLTMAQYHRDMAAWLEWQADIEQWRGSIESRLETVEEVSRLVPEILSRLGPETLSPEHLATLKATVKRLHEVSGLAYPTINYDLAQAFHVGKVEQLLEEQWSAVLRWLQTRIQANEKRKGREPQARAARPMLFGEDDADDSGSGEGGTQ
jgi:hypothetical protein